MSEDLCRAISRAISRARLFNLEHMNLSEETSLKVEYDHEPCEP